jgi:Zn-dependent alcohol dehydrogenase
VRAAVCRAFGAPLEIEELVLDGPREGEVRVRLAACAICHSDVSLIDGAWGGELPAVYGHEAAGVVEEVGAGVEGVAPGDSVVVSLLRSCGRCYFCSRGEAHLCEGEFPADRRAVLRTASGEAIGHGLHTAAFAEEVVVDRSQVATIPRSLGFDVGALLGCGVLTGFGAVVDRAQVGEGASVVVVGTGGVGLNSVQGAALSGATPIVAVDVSASKRELAMQFGATHTIDPAGGALREEVLSITGGRGADHVVVTVGRGEAVEQGLGYVRRGGTLVVAGMPPSGEGFRVETVDLAHNDVRILGSKMGSARLDRDVPRLVDLYEQGRLKLDELISRRYPLDRVNEALDDARGGEALRNVLVLDA